MLMNIKKSSVSKVSGVNRPTGQPPTPPITPFVEKTSLRLRMVTAASPAVKWSS